MNKIQKSFKKHARTFKTGAKYDVGYGKPPSQSQFKKGTSGNPNGRPKRSGPMANPIERLLQRTVAIMENGKRTDVAITEAVMMGLVKGALAGDVSAAKEVVRILLPLEESRRAALAARADPMNDTDQKAVTEIVDLAMIAEELLKCDILVRNEEGRPLVGADALLLLIAHADGLRRLAYIACVESLIRDQLTECDSERLNGAIANARP